MSDVLIGGLTSVTSPPTLLPTDLLVIQRGGLTYNTFLPPTILNVYDFGAVGDGMADDTVAIQAALNYSQYNTVFFPAGNYKITNTLTITYQTITGNQYPSINIKGVGFGSQLIWNGPNNIPVIYYIGVAGTGFYSGTTIEDIFINNYISSTGNVGIQIGNPSDSTTGIGNFIIRNNFIYSIDTGILINSESDEFTIESNHIRLYTTTGIFNNGGSGYNILRNHLQDAAVNSIGINSVGTAINIIGNVIQSNQVINAIYLNSVRGFTITGNYSESIGTSGSNPNPYFINIDNSSIGGYIGANEIGAYVNGDLIKITNSSKDIQIGSNSHSQSGGFINSLVNVASGCNGVSILGTQSTSGSVHTILGNLILNVSDSGISGPIVQTASGGLNILAHTTSTIYTIPNVGAAYMVFAQQGTEMYVATGMVVAADGATTAIYYDIGHNNAALQISISGLNIQVLNDIGTTRTIGWSILRMY